MNSFLLNSFNKNIDISSFSYRYYNWRITDLLNLQSAGMVQSAEFVFQLNGVDQSMNGVSISNPLGSSPGSEQPSKLIDNNLSTKWLDFYIIQNGYSSIIFDFGIGQSRTFTGYRWATANDAQDRDPKTWTISGSNDNINWTILHTVTNFTPTNERRIWQTSQTY